jgi:NAD(P)-dependent dehydrogenase (short-subunit alcohol dehydrogenase family)
VGDGVGRVNGKVAFVTGAARGQGRSHAVRLAEEGVNIVAVDLCHDIDTIGYPMAAPEDLDETARLIENTGQSAVIARSDVREAAQLRAALDTGLAEFGKLDIVVARAGVAGMKGGPALQAWCDVININLIGTINAIQVALPHLSSGASIIATGSTAALMDTAKKDKWAMTPEGWPTSTPSGASRISYTAWQRNWLRWEFAPMPFTRRTPTPRCCRVNRCPARSGRTSNTDTSRRRAGFRRTAGDENPLRRTRRHQQRRPAVGLRRGQIRNGHAVTRRCRWLPQVVRLPELNPHKETP